MTKPLGREYYSIARSCIPLLSLNKEGTGRYNFSIIILCIIISQITLRGSHAEGVSNNLIIRASAICLAGGSYLWDNLERCGWPGPSNTGPDLSQCPGGVLTNNTGLTTRIVTVTTPGAIINCENITGGIQITAQNVIIKNSIITYDGGGVGGSGVININDGASAIVDRVELVDRR
jgi:hypothetical protein